MYKCGKCGKGVLVNGLPSPVRACDCKKEDGVTPYQIVIDMNANAYGKSQFKQK